MASFVFLLSFLSGLAGVVIALVAAVRAVRKTGGRRTIQTAGAFFLAAVILLPISVGLGLKDQEKAQTKVATAAPEEDSPVNDLMASARAANPVSPSTTVREESDTSTTSPSGTATNLPNEAKRVCESYILRRARFGASIDRSAEPSTADPDDGSGTLVLHGHNARVTGSTGAQEVVDYTCYYAKNSGVAYVDGIVDLN